MTTYSFEPWSRCENHVLPKLQSEQQLLHVEQSEQPQQSLQLVQQLPEHELQHEVPHDEPQLEEQQELEEQQLELQHAKAAGTIKTTASQTLSIFLRINFIKYSF